MMNPRNEPQTIHPYDVAIVQLLELAFGKDDVR